MRITAASAAATDLADLPARPGTPSLRTGVVGELAREMGLRLAGISHAIPDDAPEELFVEAARTCGDLATLAVCNAGFLGQDGEAERVVNTASAAARAVRDALFPYLEEDNSPRSAFLLRDVRGAVWKASLAEDRIA